MKNFVKIVTVVAVAASFALVLADEELRSEIPVDETEQTGRTIINSATYHGTGGGYVPQLSQQFYPAGSQRIPSNYPGYPSGNYPLPSQGGVGYPQNPYYYPNPPCFCSNSYDGFIGRNNPNGK